MNKISSLPRISYYLLGLFCLCSFLQPQASGASKEWEEHMRKQLEEISDPPSPENLSLLARVAATKPDQDLHRGAIQREAWARLSSYPNFDEMLLDAIRQKRAEWKDGGYAGEYDTFRVGVVRGLEKIIDPRAVHVLGELLGDMEDPMPDYPSAAPNGMFAAEVLFEMLENPPLKKKHADLESDMVTWQLWYEQVKAGNRSFRFKGDPQDYNLKGPVSKAAVSPGAPAVPDKSSGGAGQSGPAETRPFPVLPVLLACGVLGAAAIAVLRNRQRKAA